MGWSRKLWYFSQLKLACYEEWLNVSIMMPEASQPVAGG